MTINIGINFMLSVTTTVFFIGLYGIILNRKNILNTILSIEIMLLAVNLSFAALSIYLDDFTGYIFVIFILAIAAAESAIGLSIITSFYKLKGSIQIESVKKKIVNEFKKNTLEFEKNGVRTRTLRRDRSTL